MGGGDANISKEWAIECKTQMLGNQQCSSAKNVTVRARKEE